MQIISAAQGFLIGTVLLAALLASPLRAADPATAKALVAEASKACEALPKTRRLAPEARQAWLSLAQARINDGDVEGGVAALDRVNPDHDFSLCSAWVMQIEATGTLPPEPADVDEQVLMRHRVGAIRVLIALADYEAAAKQAALMPEGEARNVSLVRCWIESAQAQRKDDQITAALTNYKLAIEGASKIRSSKTGVPCLIDICRGLVDCGFELGAEPLASNLEEALGKQVGPQTSATIEHWLQAGQVRWLLGDADGAKRNIEQAKKLYERFGEPRTGVAWKNSPFAIDEPRYRYEALRERGEKEPAAAALADWNTAIEDLDDEFKSPERTAALAEALLLAGKEADARKVLDALDPPLRSLALMQVRGHEESMQSKPLNQAMAEYCQEQFPKGRNLLVRPGALCLACECWMKAGEREKALACLAEAKRISQESKQENRAALAALLVELEEFDEAKKLLAELPLPQQAMALSEMALHATHKICEAKLADDVKKRRDEGPKMKIERK